MYVDLMDFTNLFHTAMLPSLFLFIQQTLLYLLGSSKRVLYLLANIFEFSISSFCSQPRY